MSEYAVVITPIKEEEGGGYMGSVPDLLGCVSEGDSMQEALENTLEAIDEWIDEANRRGLTIPAPGHAAVQHRKKQEAMNAAISKINDVDDRIQNLEVSIRELNEQAEHLGSWVRFSSITGFPDPLDSENDRTLPC